MKSTTATFKSIMASGRARNYLIKADLTLADNTVLNLTEADIWQDSFSIETASSGMDSFDIGCAVIGKCTFTINNIDGDFDGYDFFNASAVVWLGLEGDSTGSPAIQQYYRMGFYTVDEPQKANGLISLELLDNMWKFDVPFSSVNISYPKTNREIVQAICSYCGVTLSSNTQNYHGYNFSITEAPKDAANMNCREMLQYLAMIGCNFCTINPSGDLEIKWYDVAATASTTDVFDFNSRTSFGTEDIEITGVKFVIDNTAYSIGSAGYVLELNNPLVTADNANSVLNLIWDVLHANNTNFTLRTFEASVASDLACEIGDKVKVRDYQGNYVYSWLTNNSFKLASHSISCGAESPARTLVKRYSKTVQAAVEVAREQTQEIISNYDLDVQMMNELAVNAMGGYEDYEDIGTGGRVWYLSNMPITKNPSTGVCSFEPNSTVFKVSGSGFFVSTDGGQTWTNGYNSQTGKLVVNVLSAIGINFDWARGGTLTLGGYGNGNGELSIQNASNVEKVHGDNTGVKVGGTTGSKIHLTTDGELAYYYDNVYQGKITMYAESSSDEIQIKEFDAIRLVTDGQNAYLLIKNDNNDGEINANADTIGLTGAINLNGDVTFDGALKPTSSYTGQNGSVSVVDANGEIYTHLFSKGLLVSSTDTGNIFSNWHTWESGSETYGYITLAVGNTTATFPSINPDYAYEPFISCADNVSPPKITDMKISSNSCIVTFTAVTSAQVGSGSDCVIKLRAIGN